MKSKSNGSELYERKRLLMNLLTKQEKEIKQAKENETQLTRQINVVETLINIRTNTKHNPKEER